MDKGLIIASIIGSIAYIIKELPKKLFDIILPMIGVSVTVTSQDRESFDKVNEWLCSLDKKILSNHINVKDRQLRYGDNQTKFTIDYGTFRFTYKKCFVIISSKSVETTYNIVDKITIEIYGAKKNKTNVKQEMKELIQAYECENMIRLFPLPSRWENYSSYKRSFDDVFIQDKTMLLNSVDKWSNNKEFYNTHGITYKLGVLLYGSPGTGKTTTAKALASYMNYNIHIINIKSYRTENELIEKIIGIGSQSVILFEDIDCLLGDRENKEDDSTKPLLGTVLNILDGLMSPEEVIFIATTNKLESLDKALIREGRFDVKINVDNIDMRLATEMCDRFNVTTKEMELEKETFPINPAYLQNKIIKYINQK